MAQDEILISLLKEYEAGNHEFYSRKEIEELTGKTISSRAVRTNIQRLVIDGWLQVNGTELFREFCKGKNFTPRYRLDKRRINTLRKVYKDDISTQDLNRVSEQITN